MSDDLIEVSIANDANPTTFNYNSAGNLIDHESVYNICNHLAENDFYIYSYYERGKLRVKVIKADKKTTLYTFNLFDQLTEVKVYKSTAQQNLLEQYDYSYDALNRRVSKSYLNTQEPQKSFSHTYLYDDENIIAILDKEENILATLVHSSQIDTPLSICNEMEGETYYYHANHQGSITHLTNDVGDVVESFIYDTMLMVQY